MKTSYCHNSSIANLTHAGNVWRLDTIYTPAHSRGKGHASQLLKTICEEADREKVVLELGLLSAPGTGLRIGLLRSWYHRHGFAGESTMTRAPK